VAVRLAQITALVKAPTKLCFMAEL